MRFSVQHAAAFQRLSRTNDRRDFGGGGPTHREPDNALITAACDVALTCE